MRRLALVVGVGRFRNPALQDRSLKGPKGDAEQIYGLLTDAQGYGFPKENVCLLTDEGATLGRTDASVLIVDACLAQGTGGSSSVSARCEIRRPIHRCNNP